MSLSVISRRRKHRETTAIDSVTRSVERCATSTPLRSRVPAGLTFRLLISRAHRSYQVDNLKLAAVAHRSEVRELSNEVALLRANGQARSQRKRSRMDDDDDPSFDSDQPSEDDLCDDSLEVADESFPSEVVFAASSRPVSHLTRPRCSLPTLVGRLLTFHTTCSLI